jgi:diguanylate cyclase (GGDEF)-like protein/PAS domain S-box-containing protein
LITQVGARRAEEELRIAAIAFESQEPMLVTYANATILRVNRAFTRTTGYKPEEVIGKNPNLLQSGRHGPEFYKAMWRQVEHTGNWQGEVWDRRKNGELYPKWLSLSSVKNAVGVVTHYVGSFSDVSERKQAVATITQLAHYDSLTGLPNRILMTDRLTHALAVSARSGEYGAILFVDLDHFKMVNDTLGHEEGDKMLQEAARRLSGTLRKEDTVARFGGDEFVVLLQNLGTHRERAAVFCRAIADKLLESLSQPYRLGNKDISGTASIGVALYRGGQKADLNVLFFLPRQIAHRTQDPLPGGIEGHEIHLARKDAAVLAADLQLQATDGPACSRKRLLKPLRVRKRTPVWGQCLNGLPGQLGGRIAEQFGDSPVREFDQTAAPHDQDGIR